MPLIQQHALDFFRKNEQFTGSLEFTALDVLEPSRKEIATAMQSSTTKVVNSNDPAQKTS